MVLQPVTPHAVSFEVSLPEAMLFTRYDLSLATFSRIVSEPPETSFLLDIPDELPDAVRPRLIVTGTLDGRTSQLVHYFEASDRSVAVTLTEPVNALSPVAAEQGVARDAELMYEPQPGTISQHSLSWREDTVNRSIEVYSDDPSLPLERVRVLGFGLAPDDLVDVETGSSSPGNMSWRLAAKGPVSDIDTFLDPARPRGLSDSLSSQLPFRSFSFAP
jgi:hypothetical protein